MENVFENFTVTVMKINKTVQKIKQVEMQRYNLKSIHVMCIYYLSERKQGLTASELMRLTYEDKSALSRALKQLRNDGYVVYDVDSYNAVITLTDKGKQIATDVISKIDKAVLFASADFTDEQRDFFYRSLSAICDNIQKYYEKVVKGND